MWQKLKNRSWLWLPVTIATGFVPISVTQGLLDTLYTVIGIIFGVGFSLIISSVYNAVGNPTDRIKMRNKVRNTRDIFFFYFIISTVMNTLSALTDRQMVVGFLDNHFSSWKELECLSCIVSNFRLSFATLTILIITIAVFMRNYLSLQKFNEELDEELAK